MLKQSLTAVLLLLALITCLANSVNAQSVHRLKINVPFPFILNGQTFPAGRYVIERTDPGRPNLVTVKKADGSIVRMVLTQRVEKDKPNAAASLIFLRREGKHYLSEVWNVGAMNGIQIPLVLDTKPGDQQRKNLTFVTLRARP